MERAGVFALGAALAVCACASGDVAVDADMPAGNIIVEGIDGDTVKVRQDLRDSDLWFYWAFRVRGAAGRTVKFEFTDKRWNGTLWGQTPRNPFHPRSLPNHPHCIEQHRGIKRRT